jgi:hypothetical protein
VKLKEPANENDYVTTFTTIIHLLFLSCLIVSTAVTSFSLPVSRLVAVYRVHQIIPKGCQEKEFGHC